MKTSESSKLYLAVKEVSSYLNISQAKAYELIRRKDFPVSRFGGSIRIPRDAFLKWVDSCTYIPAEISLQISVA